jgi:hypothetical protein
MSLRKHAATPVPDTSQEHVARYTSHAAHRTSQFTLHERSVTTLRVLHGGGQMRAMTLQSRWRQLAGLAVGAGALVSTFACGTRDLTAVASPQSASAQPVTPVVVSCEPNQRTVVRPTVVNGVAMSQVECVAAAPAAEYAAAQPVAYAPAPTPVSYAPRRVSQPAYGGLSDAQVVPVSTTTVRPVRANQVVYDERPVKPTRSVKKSAIIIGSSAGAGAGLGAAIGGKKGALIGAAIGGGGATLWDQITRRK